MCGGKTSLAVQLWSGKSEDCSMRMLLKGDLGQAPGEF